MKKTTAIILSLVVLVSSVFTACTAKNETETTTAEGIDAAVNEFGFETIEVTDENGEAVTDENGEVQTTDVNVEYVTDKKGNTIARVLDKDGKPAKDKKGKEITVKSDYEVTTLPADVSTLPAGQTPSVPATEKTTKSTTMSTVKGEDTTKEELTTLSVSKDKVPLTSDNGTAIAFSPEDQQTIKNMLEVPYLYENSYENADGVPINIAAHAAIWMAQRDNLTTNAYASGTIVLDLFKYFGQTVVNFKSKCNTDANNSKIVYVAKSDAFSISSFEAPTHSVSIESIEDLGNNNYYKVTGKVEGASRKHKVVAVIQRNKLDATLGFSIKALKWS